MKNFTILCALLACTLAGRAQFKLSGKINNYTGKEQLKINIPQVYGFYNENSINIPVAANGTFSIVVPVKKQKFANLIFEKVFHSLLLNINKSLVVELNEGDKKMKVLAGTSLPENKVMTAIDLEEFPAFMSKTDAIAGMNLATLYSKVVNPYFSERDRKLDIINRSALSVNDKKVIASEVSLIALSYLNDLNSLGLKNKNTIDSLTTDIFKNETKGLDKISGPHYFAWQQDYLRYLENTAVAKMKKEGIASNAPLPYFDLSFDTLNTIEKKYGHAYLRFLLATKNLPNTITEQLTYQEIANLYYDKDMEKTLILANAFKSKFPTSTYNADINKKITALKDLLIKNETNKNIVVVNNYKEVKSIYEVIKGLEGNVVYLDVWGTWCGPCKEENKYVPALKSAFKNKDVAFVYLDMDEDEKDALWKEFIKVNGMTGIHLRKNRTTIAPFWKELLADNADKEAYYPQYFIFDKQGKMAVSKALRPSSGKALYDQINEVLNK
ncbi:hypothetical protein GCM10027049_24870 [Mucilaginibacter puniceus]